MATKLISNGNSMPKKWNLDASPSERLLGMYSMLLFGGKELSLGELSEELKCSKQAVLRLVRQLDAARFGKLLHAKRGRESYYRLDKPRHVPKLSLNAQGLHQLALCKDFMLHLLPDSMRKTMRTTLEQASAYVPEGEAQPATTALATSVAKGRIDYTAHEDVFHSIVRAIEQQKVCMVDYKQSIHYAAKQFEFAPKRLVAYREAFHIHGWIVSEKGTAQPLFEAPTTLALHRLQSVTLTRRNTGHLPDAQDAHAGNFGVLEGDPFTVRVKFTRSAATYVAERIWSTDQKVAVHTNGSITLTMTARSELEVVAWVLSFGDAAELVSPKWLREELAVQVQKLAVRYAGKGEETMKMKEKADDKA